MEAGAAGAVALVGSRRRGCGRGEAEVGRPRDKDGQSREEKSGGAGDPAAAGSARFVSLWCWRRLSLASGIGQAVEVPIGGGSIDDGLNGSCVRWQANGYIQVAWPASCFSSCLYGLGRWSNYLRTNIVDSCLGRRYETRERQDDLCEDGSKLMKKNDLSSHSSFNSKICKYPLMHKHSPLDLGKLREIAVKTVRVCEREKYC